MAKKKLQENQSWRAKWVLLYIAVVVYFILSLILTLIFMNDSGAKTVLVIYEATVIGGSIALPIGSIIVDKKGKENKNKD